MLLIRHYSLTYIPMSVILVLVTLSMIVAGSFLGAFIWAMKSGQYEDTFSPSVRMLFEEKKEENTTAGKNK
jgi:cbb3-type cytochrome oxidase maturation protein